MVSGSQPEPCAGKDGDYLLVRFLKNKLDYCRLHGIQLLYNPRAPGAHHARVLGEAAHPPRRDAGPPGGGVAVVGRRGRRRHRHGLLHPSPCRKVQPGGVQPGGPRRPRPALQAEVVARGQRRRVPHPELPVEPGLRGPVGPYGPRVARDVHAVGEDVAGPARRQGHRRRVRPVRARVHAAPRLGEAQEQGAHRDGVLLPGVLGRPRGPVPRRRGAVPRRSVGVAAAIRHALHGMRALQRPAEPDLLGGELRRRDARRARLRRRPGAPRVRVQARRAGERHCHATAVRLPRCRWRAGPWEMTNRRCCGCLMRLAPATRHHQLGDFFIYMN
ncbi:hypothetical protein PR202_gb13246 [Eleusine coracana subsp. coracana]|uniref:Uncharacterized protein n=1 Tax=Eleusine coracana subsp. coracana TaxID=191504 RepID=A0AAV5ESE4_ELECO|nr:hypothetical protein PR202_gb13246 [Eleusine coracana subsp. coracana]